MLIDYLHWQFVLAPQWLSQLIWNLERASLRFFSITFMLRTLTAPWHKDTMPFEGGTLTKLVTVIMWNIISRLIGLIIRTTVIIIWLLVQMIYVPLAMTAFLLFISWPLLAVIGLSTGLTMLVA